MRKPRAIIYDDDIVVLELLKTVLARHHYEVFCYTEPSVCPVYEEYADTCIKSRPCADVIITDFKMSRMTGLELIEQQLKRGCGIDVRNKAVISGNIDAESRERIASLGAFFIHKPFRLSELSDWLQSCEARYDLAGELALVEKRRAPRFPFREKIVYECDNGSRKLAVSRGVNISETGLCLELSMQHREGEEIRIRTALPYAARKGRFCWVRQFQDSSWLAGLAFA